MAVSLHPEVLTLLRSLLEVMDNLDRAIVAAESADGGTAVSEGVRSIHRQISELLYRYEIRGFTSLSQPFDPAKHEALAQAYHPNIPAGHVCNELRRGYLHGEALFRPAQVSVSQGIAPEGIGTGSAGKGRGPAPTRSAANRPGWVATLPTASSTTLWVTGLARGAITSDDGQRVALDAAFLSLFKQLAGMFEPHLCARAYAAMSTQLEGSTTQGCWQRLVKAYPPAERWVEDVFWEQVRSELSGKSYEVAALLAFPRAALGALLKAHGSEERNLGLTLLEVGPLVEAVIHCPGGGLIVDIHAGSPTARCGLRVGDIITRVSGRQVDDAPSVRRSLALMGAGRGRIDIDYLRGTSAPGTIRLEMPKVVRG